MKSKTSGSSTIFNEIISIAACTYQIHNFTMILSIISVVLGYICVVFFCVVLCTILINALIADNVHSKKKKLNTPTYIQESKMQSMETGGIRCWRYEMAHIASIGSMCRSLSPLFPQCICCYPCDTNKATQSRASIPMIILSFSVSSFFLYPVRRGFVPFCIASQLECTMRFENWMQSKIMLDIMCFVALNCVNSFLVWMQFSLCTQIHSGTAVTEHCSQNCSSFFPQPFLSERFP